MYGPESSLDKLPSKPPYLKLANKEPSQYLIITHE